MTVTPPDSITYGKVVGRFLTAESGRPAVGTVAFKPVVALQYTNLGTPTTIVKQRITAKLDIDGELTTDQAPPGEVGVWLVANQQYDVVYYIKNSVIDTHRILVLPEHTATAPLDLTRVGPPPEATPLIGYQYSALSLRLSSLEARPKVTPSPEGSPPPNPEVNDIWVKY